MLFVFYVGIIFAQPKDANIPKGYWKELSRIEKKAVKEELKEVDAVSDNPQFDFVIPEVPLPVIEGLEAEGNWGRPFLEIPGWEEAMLKEFQAPFCLLTLDTGEPDHSAVLKYIHPKYPSKSWTGEPVKDGHFHSTHVSGVQSAKVNDNYYGIANAAAEAGFFKHAWGKVCTNSGGCAYSWMVKGIDDFVDFYKMELEPNGWNAAITMSIGGQSSSTELSAAMDRAVKAGLVIFASAGNDAKTIISFPARDNSANAIGAHDQLGKKASFSNSGPELFLNGPGVLIKSTCLGDTECLASGTSMSCPQVAATYALLKIMRPDATPEEIINFMAEYATDAGTPGFDNEYGYGYPKMGNYMNNLDKLPNSPDQPDEPDEPTEPNNTQVSYTFLLQGPYKIMWEVSDKVESTTLVKVNEAFNANNQDFLTITELELEFVSYNDYDDAYQFVNKATKEFFSNSKLILMPGSDVRHAMAWTDHFYRILIQRQFLGYIRVLNFKAKTKNDGTYIY